MKHDRIPATRLLIVGSGDIAWRALPWLLARFRVYALCRTAETAARWRAAGAVPLPGDLDQAATLRRLRGLAQVVLHCAPPEPNGQGDPRTLRLLAALNAGGMIPRRLVYISTTGVYGDCGGARVGEWQSRKAGSPRGLRRVAAENSLRAWMRRQTGPAAPALVILRAPGIYAADRLPLARLRAGTPALLAAEDGYTSHIHADDLAHAAQLALFRMRGGRAAQICDDSELRMGDWFDAVAAAFELPAPARISRAEAEQRLPESLLSFMRESRRLDNQRMKHELRLRLRYAGVAEGLAAARQDQGMFPVGAGGRGRGSHQEDKGRNVGQQAGPQEQQASHDRTAVVQQRIDAGHPGTARPLAAHAVARTAQQQQTGQGSGQSPQPQPHAGQPAERHQQHQVGQRQEE